MADNNNNDDNNNQNNNQNTDDTDKKIAELVQKQVDEQLAEVKKNLDKAYKARDEANAKLAEKEAAERAAELKRLEEEGKHKEAAEIRIAEERAARTAAEKKVVELTRDVNVRGILSTLEFRNEKAADIAFREVIEQLTQDSSGAWIHKSGKSIKEFVESFAKDEQQSFLFKPKMNSGGGTGTGGGTGGGTGDYKSIFDLSQEEVLKLAAEGKIGVKK